MSDTRDLAADHIWAVMLGIVGGDGDEPAWARRPLFHAPKGGTGLSAIELHCLVPTRGAQGRPRVV